MKNISTSALAALMTVALSCKKNNMRNIIKISMSAILALGFAYAARSQACGGINNTITYKHTSSALGQANRVYGKNSTAIGLENIVSKSDSKNDYAFAIGYKNYATAKLTFAFGDQNTVSHKYSFAFGQKNSREVITMLKNSIKKYGQTMIIITHDGNIASQADRIFTMCDGVLTEKEGTL